MKLSRILADLGVELPLGGPDPEIRAVTDDSRAVQAGALFCCVVGTAHDGHAFARDAAAAGAAAVLVEREIETGAALSVKVPSTVEALARAAVRLAGDPQDALTLVGVTGTNGKTTTTYLFESIARAADVSCGVVGTVSYRFAGVEREAPHTTPGPVALAALLAQMRDTRCTHAAMEISSHALAQGRVAALPFAAAAFTNLTRDHLDYHGDIESYFAQKARLFRERLTPSGCAVLNADDPFVNRLAAEQAGRTLLRFSLTDPSVELFAEDVAHGIEGISARVRTPAGTFALRSRLVGLHNLQNLLTATGLALGVGFSLEAIERGLAASSGAPGRLERIDGRGLSVFVDYAHTDDALRRACAALREVAPRRLIAVFGCGGDRDRGKRPLMGEAAAKAADLCVVTSDNPRTEVPDEIVRAIVPGVERAGRKALHVAEAKAGADGYVVELDRRAAIELAIACAEPGDVLLIAGKGHEDYQIVGREKRHFDDREEARRALGVQP